MILLIASDACVRASATVASCASTPKRSVAMSGLTVTSPVPLTQMPVCWLLMMTGASASKSDRLVTAGMGLGGAAVGAASFAAIQPVSPTAASTGIIPRLIANHFLFIILPP